MPVNTKTIFSGTTFIYTRHVPGLNTSESSHIYNCRIIHSLFKISLQDCLVRCKTYTGIILTVFFLLPISLYAQNDINFKQAGLTNLRKGEYIDALANLNNAIQREPGLSELYFLRGYAKYGLDDFLGAERDYTISIELSPVLSDVFINRAMVRAQQQNFRGALTDFARAQELTPDNPEIYVNRARTNLFLKNYYACIVDCRKAIELKYNHESIYILKGTSEVGIKRYQNAIDDFNKAIAINPNDPNGYIQLGSVHVELEQADSAIHCYSRAIHLDSNNTYALFNRSLGYIKTKELKLALNDLNKIVRLSPYNSYAYFNRAIVLNDMKDKKGAIRDFTAVINLNPKNIISYYYRGLLKAELKDYQGALADLDKTIELYPDYADAYYSRYEIKNKKGDRAGALKDYQRAMEIGAKNHVDPATLAAQKNYLESLVKLSGDFEEMNTLNSKFQNQYIDIQLISMFSLFFGKLNYDQICFYDTYGKDYYFTNILALTNRQELLNDSVCRQEIAIQTRIIDSVNHGPVHYYRRAAAWAALKNFNKAFNDYDSVLYHDPDFVMAYFSRAQTRFDLIRLLQQQDEAGQEISIGKAQPKVATQLISSQRDQSYEKVLADLNKAIQLDPFFSFAYFNKGFVHAAMGNYPSAIDDLTQAISCRDKFAEAYYNRGLMYILVNDRTRGCEDLSRAGELGILDAYRVMKRYCYK